MEKIPSINSDYYRILAGRILPLIALLIVTILYSHNLELDDYGIFQSVWMYSNLVSVVMGFGIAKIIFSVNVSVFFSFIKKYKHKSIGIYSILWLTCIILFWMITSFSVPLKLSIIFFILFQNLNTIAETWLIKNGGDKKYFIINLFYSVTFLAWHYYILLNEYHLYRVMFGIAFIAFLKLLVLVIVDRKFSVENSDLPERKQFISNWVFTGFNEIIGVFTKWVDKIILVYLLAPSEFAIFFNGSIEIPLLGILIGMTGNYMMMQMTTNVKMDSHRITTVFRDNFLLLSSIAFPLFFCLLFFRYDIFLIFFGEKYLASLPVFVISIMIIPIQINHYGTILQVSKKSYITTIGALIDLLIAVSLVFTLYPLYGTEGAAAALVISTLASVIFFAYHSARLLRTKILSLIPVRTLVSRFVICGMLFYIVRLASGSLQPFLAVCTGLLTSGVLGIYLAKDFIPYLRKKHNFENKLLNNNE